jgi:hypothetical protein
MRTLRQFLALTVTVLVTSLAPIAAQQATISAQPKASILPPTENRHMTNGQVLH